MDAKILEPSRWKLIFTLLSLDTVRPFYKAMGLQLPDEQQFLQLLRRLIAAEREAHTGEMKLDGTFAGRVLQAIEDSFGKAIAIHFFKWATTVFYWTHHDQPHWSAWQIIFLYNDALEQHVRLAPESYDVIEQLSRSDLTDDIEQQMEILRLKPLSAWDAEMYSSNHFSVDGEQGNLIDPLSIIGRTVEMNRFQIGFEQLMAQLSSEEKTNFWAYGQQMLADLEIAMPETFRHPNDLRRRI